MLFGPSHLNYFIYKLKTPILAYFSRQKIKTTEIYPLFSQSWSGPSQQQSKSYHQRDQLYREYRMQVVDWLSKQAGKLADNFNSYKFYVKHTPEKLDSSTMLSLSVFTSREEEAVVPCHFKWWRLKNGLVTQAQEFRGNTFICEPSDIGCFIQAEVTSTDPQYAGVAMLKFGPVEIDIVLRQAVENAISVGEAKFNVDLSQKEDARQCLVSISDDFIHIAHANSSANFKFYYCLGEPMFQVFPKDPTKIRITFSQKLQAEVNRFLSELYKKNNDENCLNIKFINRKQKDEFLLVMKGFNAKKQLKNSAIITKIEKLEVDDKNINQLLHLQSLKGDLLRLFNITKRQQQQKHTYYLQTCKLQQQIEDIISSYTKLIEGKFKNKEQFESSFADFQNRKDQALSHKYTRLEEQNQRLKDFIRDNMDKDYQSIEVVINKPEFSQRNTSPFSKKNQPFANIISNQNILANLESEEINHLQPREFMEQKLNRSMQKIEQLEAQLNRYERSARSVIMEQIEKSIIKNNGSALDVSTGKVVEQKIKIERKYAVLKEQYKKLKQAYKEQKQKSSRQPQQVFRELRQDSLLLPKSSQNPQFNHDGSVNMLKQKIVQLEKERDNLRLKVDFLGLELKKQKEDHLKTKQKLERKMLELNEQLQSSRKNSDILNRSQHLSMQMDDYNAKQNQVLKQQLAFLQGENIRLSKMGQKYKSQYKKLKQQTKVMSPS